MRRSLPQLAEVKIQCPNLGDSITEGTIVEWSVGIGEAVSEGDVVAIVETDKVSSPASGGRKTSLSRVIAFLVGLVSVPFLTDICAFFPLHD